MSNMSNNMKKFWIMFLLAPHVYRLYSSSYSMLLTDWPNKKDLHTYLSFYLPIYLPQRAPFDIKLFWFKIFRNEKIGRFHDILTPNLYIRVFPNGDVLYSIRWIYLIILFSKLWKENLDGLAIYISR